jgi:hypothetical protein
MRHGRPVRGETGTVTGPRAMIYGMAKKQPPPEPSIGDSVQGLVNSVRGAATRALDGAGRTVDSAGKLASVPPDTIELIAELPKVMLALADMIERANTVIDRVEKLTVVADPAIYALDAVIPPLMDVTQRMTDATRVMTNLPGMGTFRKVTGLGPDEPPKRR